MSWFCRDVRATLLLVCLIEDGKVELGDSRGKKKDAVVRKTKKYLYMIPPPRGGKGIRHTCGFPRSSDISLGSR